MGNGLVAFSAIGALAAVPALSATVLRSPLPPPAKLQPQTSDGVPATPLKGLGSSHGGSTIAGVDLGSRAAYIRTTVIAPLMLVITLVIGSQISFAGWVRAKPTASHAIVLHAPALHAAAARATALHAVALRALPPYMPTALQCAGTLRPSDRTFFAMHRTSLV